MIKLSPEQAAIRLGSSGNLLNKLVYLKRGLPGRSIGSDNLKHEERVEIAAEARTHSHREVAEKYDVSQQTVDSVARGIVGYTRKDSKLISDTNERVSHIRNSAVTALMGTLGLITPTKMKDLGAKDLSSTAANLARVVRDTSPQELVANSNVQFVIYAPDQRTEKSFEVIDV